MKKVKFEERLENFINAFFNAGVDKKASALMFADGSAALQMHEKTAFTEKAGSWLNIARQIFLFLPGAFLLFFTTLTSFFFIPQIGFFSQMLFWLLSGSFLCLAGLGSLRNVKNLLIPFSIVLFACCFGFLFSLFPGDVQTALYFEYSIYLFPAVLIVSKILKDSIDAK